MRPLTITQAGDHYTGEWNKQSQRHGFGSCIIAAIESFYEGFWKHDKLHGRGRLINKKGHVIEGTFAEFLAIANFKVGSTSYDGQVLYNG